MTSQGNDQPSSSRSVDQQSTSNRLVDQASTSRQVDPPMPSRPGAQKAESAEPQYKRSKQRSPSTSSSSGEETTSCSDTSDQNRAKSEPTGRQRADDDSDVHVTHYEYDDEASEASDKTATQQPVPPPMDQSTDQIETTSTEMQTELSIPHTWRYVYLLPSVYPLYIDANDLVMPVQHDDDDEQLAELCPITSVAHRPTDMSAADEAAIMRLRIRDREAEKEEVLAEEQANQKAINDLIQADLKTDGQASGSVDDTNFPPPSTKKDKKKRHKLNKP